MRTARIKHLLALIFALAGFPGAFFIAGGQPAHGEGPIIPVIQMQNVPLDAALANLARQASLNYILDPKLAGPTHGSDGKYVPPPSVSIRWENLSAQQALTRLLGEHGLCAVESPVSSVTRITFTNQVANVVDKAWVTSGTNAIIPLLQAQDAPLDKILTQLAEATHVNVVLDPTLSNPRFAPAQLTKTAQVNVVLDPSLSNSRLATGGPPVQSPMVSFRWEKMTARQALAALCENYNLVMVKDAATGGVRITPK